ncbi:hypothetical protein [Rhodococcus koreensis]|uniref:hypothetical protein n=1 Tax=Rhodococcus koreensis TaxID=99653 RepID=UPI0019813852|nr:hypothetical protein [Rhodococcus koreensis]QSE84078.1 hypothetical protein JWS14_35515 [Rhodococcus koreensis]
MSHDTETAWHYLPPCRECRSQSIVCEVGPVATADLPLGAWVFVLRHAATCTKAVTE